MKIKAAVLRQSGLPRPYTESKPLSVEEVELDPPKSNEVMIKIKAVGLCHSDLVAISGERGMSITRTTAACVQLKHLRVLTLG